MHLVRNYKHMKQLFLIFPILAILGASCEQNSAETEILPGEPVDIQLSSGADMVIESSNEFGFDIFKALILDEPAEKNIFISPTSISLALAMTLNGANNDTEDSMAYAMRMDHLSSDNINLTFSELMAGLQGVDEKVIMEIANSIWYRQGFSVEHGFLSINQQYYGAEISELDFNSPEAVDIINAWVSDQTHGKIPDIINQITPENVMFLINAIYFYGTWTKEFNPESTNEANFFLENGSNKIVDMMAKEDTIGYLENDLFQLAELDYGQGNYSMLVFLPKSLTAEELALEFSFSNWESWMSSITPTGVILSLPKFKFGYDKKLNDILSSMGMGIAFDPWQADFTGINSLGNLYISLVKHKTFVEVSEEGTEAAAVTVVGVSFTSVNPNEPVMKYMTVNRPFLFAIREKTTNAIVFMGKVAEPLVE